MKTLTIFYTLMVIAICTCLMVIEQLFNIEMVKLFIEYLFFSIAVIIVFNLTVKYELHKYAWKYISIAVLVIVMIYKIHKHLLWNAHIQAPFPKSIPEECFDCNLTNCNNCPNK